MSNTTNQQMNSAPNGPRNSMQGSNNPKLQSVNYVTILPEGKTSGYKENQQIDFQIDPVQFPYIDGKQSYLLLNVTPTGKFSNSGAQADVPLCFPPNMGANSLVNRLTCRVNDGTGRIIEDREAYNLYNGLMNSYTHDSDVFPALAKVEGVSGRNSSPNNRSVEDVNNCYFYPMPTVDPSTNVATGGNKLIPQTSFVIPIQLGLFSAFGEQHHAIPNMEIGGTHLTYYLEKANRVLQTLCHKFHVTKAVNGQQSNVAKSVEFTEALACTFTSTTELTIDNTVCDCTVSVNGKLWSTDMCAYRVGMPMQIGNGAVALITQVTITGGLIGITLGQPIGVVGADTIKPDTISERSYEIMKVELRVLNTMPDMPTMKNIRRAVQRGINFNSTQLFKVSTAAQLKNAVVDIPESLTRCLSIMDVPCQQGALESVDGANSYIFPRPDSVLNDNDNNYSYQWQVRQVLIPNLQVDTNKLVDAKSDNVIYFNQQLMAQRPMYPVRSLGDNKSNEGIIDSATTTRTALDLDLPFFFPLLLAPMNSSFDLIDSAPQLRIENSGTNLSDITPKLHFVFINHVRKLSGGGDQGVEISF